MRVDMNRSGCPGLPMSHTEKKGPRPSVNDVLIQVAEAVQQIRYGSVELTIHDGRIVQIETRAKTRFTHEAHKSRPDSP